MISAKYKRLANASSHWILRRHLLDDHIDFLKRVKIPPAKVLDIGCAEGFEANILKVNKYKVTGIDIEGRFIREAAKKFKGIRFLKGSAENLVFKDNSFDAVICVNTLFYTDLKRSIPEILRVLRIGGVGVITFDTKIMRLDKIKIIHEDRLVRLKKLLGNVDFLDIKRKTRKDLNPFPHKHYFYMLTFRK